MLKVEIVYENGVFTYTTVEAKNIKGLVRDLIDISDDIEKIRIVDVLSNFVIFATDKYETNYEPCIINENTYNPFKLVNYETPNNN